MMSTDEHWVSPDKQNSSSYRIRAEDARTSDIRPGAWQGVSRTPFLTKKEKIIHSCGTAWHAQTASKKLVVSLPTVP